MATYEEEEDDAGGDGGRTEEVDDVESPQSGDGFTTMGIDGTGAAGNDLEEDGLDEEDEMGLLTGDREEYAKRALEDNCCFCLDLRTGCIWISVLVPMFLIIDMVLFTPWNQGSQSDFAWYWWIEYGWIVGSFIAAGNGIYGMAHFKMRSMTVLQCFLILMMLEAVYELLMWLQFFTTSNWFRYDPIFFVFYFGYLAYGTYICTLFINKVNGHRITKGRPMYSAFRVMWPNCQLATPQKSQEMIPQFQVALEKLVTDKAFAICRCGNPRRGFLILGGIGVVLSVLMCIATLFWMAGFFWSLVSLAGSSYFVNGFRKYRLSHIYIGFLVAIFFYVNIIDVIVRSVFQAMFSGTGWPLLRALIFAIWASLDSLILHDLHLIIKAFNNVHASNGVALFCPYGIKVPKKFVQQQPE